MTADATYRVTYLTGVKRLLPRQMIKISWDGGETWWPRVPLELHVAGETYVLLTNGTYHHQPSE